MRRLRRMTLAAAACLGVVAAALPAPAASADPEPIAGYNRMGPAPEGANDWNCKPSAAHPRPVVLVHGTGSSMQHIFKTLSPALKNEGYCVFALNYGGIPTWWDPNLIVWGVSDIRTSARELSGYVDAVLARTGASQVDLIGHSQGGMLSRQYLKFEGGANAADPARNKVANVVSLAPTNHGTTFNGLQQMYLVLASLGFHNDQISQFVFGIAGRQQLIGSRLIADLNAGGETMPGVEYTIIATRNDQVATPPEYSFLSTARGNVDNVWVQDGCENLQVTHDGLVGHPRSQWLVFGALDPGYKAKHAAAPCDPAAPQPR